MKSKKTGSSGDYIAPLNMNGLQGRMLHVPAKGRSKNEFLLVYGHHALLERWWGLVENFNDLGAVTMPDLPGFGGMDSFRKIGRKPTIDNYADYLAAFIRLRYKHKRITIVGISFGFVIVTRMLQRSPDLAKKVKLVVSIVGFVHHDDFLFKPFQKKAYSRITNLISKRPIAYLIRYFALNSFIINKVYVRLPAGKKRFFEMEADEFSIMMEFEVKLWQSNDVSTHWATTSEFLQLDNCNLKIDLPVWHVASKHDHYFNNHHVEQHLKVVYNDYRQSLMNTRAHTPSIIADKKGLAIMLPPALKKALRGLV